MSLRPTGCHSSSPRPAPALIRAGLTVPANDGAEGASPDGLEDLRDQGKVRRLAARSRVVQWRWSLGCFVLGQAAKAEAEPLLGREVGHGDRGAVHPELEGGFHLEPGVLPRGGFEVEREIWTVPENVPARDYKPPQTTPRQPTRERKTRR